MRNFVCEHTALILYLCHRYPSYVGTDDIKHIIKGDIRQRQRVMKALADDGYLDVIRSWPLSYRINPDKFQGFENILK